VVNAIIRPIAFILTLPVTILTLGLFLLVLNAAMVWLVGKIVPGFHAPWFMPAFLTSLIVWLTGWVGSWLIGQRGFERYARR
jgi:putative membrane protein